MMLYLLTLVVILIGIIAFLIICYLMDKREDKDVEESKKHVRDNEKQTDL